MGHTFRLTRLKQSRKYLIKIPVGRSERRKRKKYLELVQISSQTLGPNTIRWVMGPTNIIVTIPQEMGLSQNFESHLSKFSAEACVECPKTMKRPFLPYRTQDGTLIFPTGEFVEVYYSEELKYARDLGYKVIPIRGYLFQKMESPFKEYINSLFESRSNAKKEGNIAVSYVYKLLWSSFSLFFVAITDDDLRETAYEILLAVAGASGGLIVPSKDKKKEKKSRLMSKLRSSKNENTTTHSRQSQGLIGILETMRVQMEISEAMDIRTRKGLLNAMVGKVGKRMDSLLIPLKLLCCVSRTEFSDKKSYIKWQKRQLT